MTASSTRADRRSAMLAELAEITRTLAKHMEEQAHAAKTPREAAMLDKTVRELSLSVRETLALDARLERERLDVAPEQTIEAAIARFRRDRGGAAPRR